MQVFQVKARGDGGYLFVIVARTAEEAIDLARNYRSDDIGHDFLSEWYWAMKAEVLAQVTTSATDPQCAGCLWSVLLDLCT